jgi:hypothetical protein
MKMRLATGITLCTLVFLLSSPCEAKPVRHLLEPREIRVTAQPSNAASLLITINKGDRVRLLLDSGAKDLRFSILDLHIEEQVFAGQTKTIELAPELEGRFPFSFSAPGENRVAGELIVSGNPAERAANMKVTFDHEAPGIVIVEAGGERLRINTGTKTIERLTDAALAATQQTAKEQAQPQLRKERESSKAYEPYDYRVVNIPTPKRVRRHSLNMMFTHRFQEPITAFENEPRDEHIARISKDLFGLDSFAVSSFGLTFGITDRLYANVYRSPLCQPGLCKTIELGLGYHLLDEAGKSPLALSAYASVEGDYNFTERYTWNFQTMLARSVTKYVNVFFSPAVHVNSNGGDRFKEFLRTQPLAAKLRLGQHSGSFGFGVNAQVRPTTSLLFEYTPRVGFRMGQIVADFNTDSGQLIGFRNRSEAEIGFGIEKRIGRHVFSLTFANTQTTTTARYNSSNLGLPPSKFTIGFNLFRRLL